jgi:hypothetical protein
MNRSESITNLAAALSKAQAIMTGALKDSENPHFRSKYADLSAVWEACREPLCRNGLSVVQLPAVSNQATVTVETILLHESGEYIGGSIEVPVSKADAQGVGSAITYARRYSLAAVVGIAPEDDDGEGAVGRTAQKTTAKPPQDARKSPVKPEPAAGQATTPPEKTAPQNNKRDEYLERVRGALRCLFGEDKTAALNHVEALSTWTDKSTGEIKMAGEKDYRKLTDKRLEILCHNLEAEVKKAPAAEDTGCATCGKLPGECDCPF